MRACRPVLAGLVLCLWASGCSPAATPSPTAAPTPTAQPPTAVARVRPSPTPEPLAAVESEKIPGVVVPAAAMLTEFAPADEETDAQAQYTWGETDVASALAWFREEMPKVGWGAPEDLDGALQFVHETQLSARHAREGIRRHALVMVSEADDGVEIVMTVEEPD